MNIVWESENRFHIGDTRFRAFKLGMNQQQSTLEQFVFQKPREMIERYASLIAEDAPQHIFELGIWRGGSPVFAAPRGPTSRPRGDRPRGVRVLGDRLPGTGSLPPHFSVAELRSAYRHAGRYRMNTLSRHSPPRSMLRRPAS